MKIQVVTTLNVVNRTQICQQNMPFYRLTWLFSLKSKTICQIFSESLTWMYNYNLTGYPQTLVWLKAGLLKCVMCPGSDGEQLHSECTGDSQATLMTAALIFPIQSKSPSDIPVPLVTVPASSHLWSCNFLIWRFLRSKGRRNDSSLTAEIIRSSSLFSHFPDGYSAWYANMSEIY